MCVVHTLQHPTAAAATTTTTETKTEALLYDQTHVCLVIFFGQCVKYHCTIIKFTFALLKVSHFENSLCTFECQLFCHLFCTWKKKSIITLLDCINTCFSKHYNKARRMGCSLVFFFLSSTFFTVHAVHRPVKKSSLGLENLTEANSDTIYLIRQKKSYMCNLFRPVLGLHKTRALWVFLQENCPTELHPPLCTSGPYSDKSSAEAMKQNPGLCNVESKSSWQGQHMCDREKTWISQLAQTNSVKGGLLCRYRREREDFPTRG